MLSVDTDEPGGLVYYKGDSDPGSLNPAMAFTMLLLKYAPMASSSDKRDSYTVSACTTSHTELTAQRNLKLTVRHSPRLRSTT